VIETFVLEPLIPVIGDIIVTRSFIFTDITVWFRNCVTYIQYLNHENEAPQPKLNTFRKAVLSLTTIPYF
jgi:hypothetical protein